MGYISSYRCPCCVDKVRNAIRRVAFCINLVFFSNLPKYNNISYSTNCEHIRINWTKHNMDTCQFTFVSRTDTIRTVLGVEQSWDVLCERLHRTGSCLPGGTHFFPVSVEGPELFAVDTHDDQIRVYYHDEGGWHPYITARDIIFGMMPDTGAVGALVRATKSVWSQPIWPS